MKNAGRKPTTPVKGPTPDDQPDPIEGAPDADQFPRRNTEQNREMRPGAPNREEIRERTHRNKE